jgi:type IV secretion system protein VirB8
MVSFFKSKDSEQKRVKNWYDDRIGIITLQRNFLMILIIGLFGILVFSMFTLFVVTKSRNIEPFIIEISKKSGAATLVSPVTVKEYSANRVITNYFSIEYIKARETFNAATYQYNYYTFVRTYSAQDVYDSFKFFLRLSNPESYLNIYSNSINSKFEIRSMQYLSDNSVQFRFSIESTDNNLKITKRNKIATIGFEYANLNMREVDRYINPLGFIINSYQVDNDYT